MQWLYWVLRTLQLEMCEWMNWWFGNIVGSDSGSGSVKKRVME